MDIIIDLKDCDNEKKALLKLGEILCLGGIDGNLPARSDLQMKGWGLNWDALKDSLSCLDTGGIWGNSPIPQFPLKLVFVNYETFRNREPNKFKTLKEIMETTKNIYEKDGKNFIYIFKIAKLEKQKKR